MLIWGVKTDAVFDVWSIEHIASGVSIAGLLIPRSKLFNRWSDEFNTSYFLGFLVICFMWETFEHYLEMGLLGEYVMFWFQGVEHWGNRMISDPILMIIGFMIARSNPALVIPSRFFSLIWLIVHLFIFPHSMWLHR